jgi:hypothetical protein
MLMLALALLVGWSATVGTVGAGAMFFAAGFLVISAIAGVQFMRGRTPTVF